MSDSRAARRGWGPARGASRPLRPASRPTGLDPGRISHAAWCRPSPHPRDSRIDHLGSSAVAYAFKLPDLGEGLTEGEVARWLVAVGDEIAEDQPLVEIQTDKTTVEIPSPAAGLVSRILVAEGEVAAVGAVLVVIGAEDDGDVTEADAPEEDASPAPVRPSQGSAKVQATPLVRRVAQELGVDLGTV